MKRVRQNNGILRSAIVEPTQQSVELAASEIYSIPLSVCVADTQAGMGYMIGQCLMNELARRGAARLLQ